MKKKHIVTYKQALEFPRFGNNYIKGKRPETKFQVAVFEIAPKLRKIQEEYNEKRKIILDNTANVDDTTGSIMRDAQGTNLYTIEGMRQRDQQLKDLLAADCNLLAVYAVALPKDGLSIFEADAFEGMVITTEQADAIRNQTYDDLPD